MKKFRSYVQWGEDNLCNMTQDDHETEEQAIAVCRMLEKEGLGGEGRIYPFETWVKPIKICEDCDGSGAFYAHVCGGDVEKCYRLCPDVQPCCTCNCTGYVEEDVKGE